MITRNVWIAIFLGFFICGPVCTAEGKEVFCQTKPGCIDLGSSQAVNLIEQMMKNTPKKDMGEVIRALVKSGQLKVKQIPDLTRVRLKTPTGKHCIECITADFQTFYVFKNMLLCE